MDTEGGHAWNTGEVTERTGSHGCATKRWWKRQKYSTERRACQKSMLHTLPMVVVQNRFIGTHTLPRMQLESRTPVEDKYDICVDHRLQEGKLHIPAPARPTVA